MPFWTNTYAIGCFAAIGGGLFGLDISSMSGVVDNAWYKQTFGKLQADGSFAISSNMQGSITASMPAGSFGGALINTYLADKLGRKNAIIFAAGIWVAGCVLQCASQNIGMLVTGRVIAGISIGIESAIVPIYQAEIAKPNIRGRIISLQQWAITWGILIQYFIQFGSSYINSTASFRLPWGIQMIPAIILAIGMTKFPESPRWLMDHGRRDEAIKVLADVHANGDLNDELVMLEIAEIEEQVEFEKKEGAKSYLDLLKPGVFRRVWLGCSLQAWQQLTGMNVMMYYVVFVFQSAGITGTRGNLIASSIQYVLNVLFTIPAIIYIDRWGRRPMLLIGSTFMFFWLFLVGGLMGRYGHRVDAEGGTTSWLITGHDSATKGIIVCSYLFVCSFAITWGPCVWTYAGELFPMKVRAKAVSLATASNWAFNFALAYAVPPGFHNIQYKTYFIFATFCVAMTIHVFFCFPETKGRTLEEMEAIFESGNIFTAWRLPSDLGKKTLTDVAGHTRDAPDHEKSELDDKKV